MGIQARPAPGRCAQAEMPDHVVADAAVVEVFQRLRAVGRIQGFVIEFCGLDQRGIEPVAILFRPRVLAALQFRYGHVRALGQVPDRLGEFHVLDVHHKGDDVAARVAAEAIEHLLFLIDGKRRGFLAVEGTEPPMLGALLLQRDVFGDDRNDVGFIAHFVDPLAGEPACHALPVSFPPSILLPVHSHFVRCLKNEPIVIFSGFSANPSALRFFLTKKASLFPCFVKKLKDSAFWRFGIFCGEKVPFRLFSSQRCAHRLPLC